MTPDIERLYESIGAELRSIPCEPVDHIALYAEAEDGVMSADVFYLVPGGKKLIFRFGGDKLTELLFELWEKWAAVPGQEPWRVLLYTVKNKKFDIKLTYTGDFDENLAEAERRLSVVQAVLGNYPPDYSRERAKTRTLGLRDISAMVDFTEFSFVLPIYHLVTGRLDAPMLSPDFEELCALLGMKLEAGFLGSKYFSYGTGPTRGGSGDVLVLRGATGDSFMLLDLYNGITDQHNMVDLGVHCHKTIAETVRTVLMRLHRSGVPRSHFLEGKLHLSKELQPHLFPRTIDDCGETCQQQLEIYDDGMLVYRSSAL